MVPSALRVSPASPATSTSGAVDFRGASVVCPAAAVTDGEGVHLRMRDRKWCTLLSGQAVSVLCKGSEWKGVGHATSISLSGTIFVVGGSR